MLILTKIERTIDLPVTQEQLDLWENGLVAQKAFPNLNASQREFIITGCTDEEWQVLCDSMEEYDDGEVYTPGDPAY